jgi:hypothetical protein
MRTLAVIVPHVLAEDVVQMSTSPDERVIKTVVTHGSRPPLGKGVGPRSTKRCADDACSLAGKDVVEAGAELRVSVVDDEPDAKIGVHDPDVPRLLAHPRLVGVSSRRGHIA